MPLFLSTIGIGLRDLMPFHTAMPLESQHWMWRRSHQLDGLHYLAVISALAYNNDQILFLHRFEFAFYYLGYDDCFEDWCFVQYLISE